MTHRGLLAVGFLAIAGGLITLVVLAITGVLAHPDAAASTYGPPEFIAIGGSLGAILVGVVVTFRSLVTLPDPDRR